MAAKSFGAMLKELRITAGFGLRHFAKLVDMLPSNLSNIENGRRLPPDDESKLLEIATALGLAVDSPERGQLFDAARRTNALPADIRHVANRNCIPALLRTVNNFKLTEQQVEDLIKEIQTRYGE